MNGVTQLDLHQLANFAGFGSGRQALMQAGAWDEAHGLKPRDYRVTVEYSLIAAVTVTGRTKEEAIGRATELLEEGHHGNVDIIEAEAECIERAGR